MLKACFVHKIFTFLSSRFYYVEKRFDMKIKVNSKNYDVTDWTVITIHILPNISRGKGNQAMKFGQLIEYKRRKYFSLKIM